MSVPTKRGGVVRLGCGIGEPQIGSSEASSLRWGPGQVRPGADAEAKLAQNACSYLFMKTASPTLLPLLRSRSQGDILAVIMLDPEQERSLSEIAEEARTSVPTVQREVARLEEGGLVTTSRRGNTRLVRPVTDSVVFQPLADLSSGRWQVGAAEVENLIDQGEIEVVEPSPEHADMLMRQAETHLASLPALLPADPPGAFALLYDAARKSMGACSRDRGCQQERSSRHPGSDRGTARRQRQEGRPAVQSTEAPPARCRVPQPRHSRCDLRGSRRGARGCPRHRRGDEEVPRQRRPLELNRRAARRGALSTRECRRTEDVWGRCAAPRGQGVDDG